MPITHWDCPVCKQVVPLDHYETTPCGGFIPPDYAAATLAEERRERMGGVRVTIGLSCPRSRAITSDINVTVDPLTYNALLAGQAWDRFMQDAAPPDKVKVQVVGVIEGIDIGGEIDRIVDLPGVGLTIADWKHSNNFRQKWLKQEGKPSTEYVVQTSIYAELYEQTFSVRPSAGAIWYHFSGAPPTEPITPFTYELMGLDACLAHKPYGGEFTVLDLYKQADVYQKAKNKPDPVRVDAFNLPLAGKSMSFGSKEFCDYCQVRNTCFEQAFGASF